MATVSQTQGKDLPPHRGAERSLMCDLDIVPRAQQPQDQTWGRASEVAGLLGP